LSDNPKVSLPTEAGMHRKFVPPGLHASAEHTMHRETAHRLARRALFAFILTFVLARVFVVLIMSKQMPNLYFLALVLLSFAVVLYTAGIRLGDTVGPRLHDLEAASSP